MRSLSGDLLLQRLGEQPDDKLHKRLYNAIRTSILDGSLPPSSRLPASRDLAQELSLSRNTVLTVYEQLLAEGYVSARAGSGTFGRQRATAARRTVGARRHAAAPRQRQPQTVGGVHSGRPRRQRLSSSAVQQDPGAPQPPPDAAAADLQQSGRQPGAAACVGGVFTGGALGALFAGTDPDHRGHPSGDRSGDAHVVQSGG